MTSASPTLASDDTLAAGRRDRAYRSARRHSAWVRRLKVGIPLGSAVVLGGIVIMTTFNPLGRIPGLTLGPVSMSGTKVTMESPRLTGFRKDARPYEVTAKAAFQDIRKPSIIELKDMKGRLAMDGAGATAELVSAMGVFDTSKEALELREDIRITTSKGEEVFLRSASVDFKAGTVVSREPVRITSPNATVEAEGVHVSDSGSTISFTGRVRTRFSRIPEAAGTPEAVGAPVASTPARVSQAAAE